MMSIWIQCTMIVASASDSILIKLYMLSWKSPSNFFTMPLLWYTGIYNILQVNYNILLYIHDHIQFDIIMCTCVDICM